MERTNMYYANKIANNFEMILAEDDIEKYAKESNFMKRIPQKITPQNFVYSLIVGELSNNDASYSQQAFTHSLISRKKLSKVAIAKRISDNSVTFMQLLLDHVLKQKLGNPKTNAMLQSLPYDKILIQDATTFKLSNELKDIWTGCGGHRSAQAELKNDFIFDLVSKSIKSITTTKGIYSDSHNAQNIIPFVNKKTLILRDLGYSKKENFIQIIEKGGYFVSKWRFQTNYYDKDGNTIDVIKLIKKKKKTFSKVVYLDKKGEYKIILLVQKMPKKIADKRIEQYHKTHKKKNKSSNFLETLKYNIFITNVDDEILSIKKISTLYTLRWQIELFFKVLKSYFGIHKIKKYKRKEAVETFLLVKMILVAIGLNVFKIIDFEDNEPSLLKFMSNFRIGFLFVLIIYLSSTFSSAWYDIINGFILFSGFENRKRKSSIQEIYENFTN